MAIVALLLEHDGVDVNLAHTRNRSGGYETRESGLAPLHGASRYGHAAVVRLLLAHHGVDVNAKGMQYGVGATPWDIAIDNGHTTVAKQLRDAGAVTRHQHCVIA